MSLKNLYIVTSDGRLTSLTIKPRYLNFTIIAVGDLLISRLSKQAIIADYHDYATSREMAESLHGMFLVRKKNTKSSVWHNFGMMATEDGREIEKEQEKPICRTCGKGVLAKGSNTTNLFQHLREHHPQIYADLAPSSSKAKLNSGNNITESTKQTTLEESIAPAISQVLAG